MPQQAHILDVCFLVGGSILRDAEKFIRYSLDGRNKWLEVGLGDIQFTATSYCSQLSVHHDGHPLIVITKGKEGLLI